jgi:6-phosphogluconate dehydrogenase (decarboxylating)
MRLGYIQELTEGWQRGSARRSWLAELEQLTIRLLEVPVRG